MPSLSMDELVWLFHERDRLPVIRAIQSGEAPVFRAAPECTCWTPAGASGWKPRGWSASIRRCRDRAESNAELLEVARRGTDLQPANLNWVEGRSAHGSGPEVASLVQGVS